MNNEIQRIISGTSRVRYGENICAAIRYLRAGAKSSALAKADKHFKREETTRLKAFIGQEQLWMDNINLSNYVSEGAEQKVYLKDGQSVLKLNDAIYYLSWEDYFINLL
jgi:hypothetical protein